MVLHLVWQKADWCRNKISQIRPFLFLITVKMLGLFRHKLSSLWEYNKLRTSQQKHQKQRRDKITLELYCHCQLILYMFWAELQNGNVCGTCQKWHNPLNYEMKHKFCNFINTKFVFCLTNPRRVAMNHRSCVFTNSHKKQLKTCRLDNEEGIAILAEG